MRVMQINLYEPFIVLFSLSVTGLVMLDGRREFVDPDRRPVSLSAVADDVPPAWVFGRNRSSSVRRPYRLSVHVVTD